ncbi:hypothetical protein SAMN05421837_114116 [Amycolatopsis pretoriensis]|uniref:Uncharacterized protein n=1 Tax=Amycolatopsis pretoriensis TaxID=218821 RepID=A0A1H5RGQ8_9PSEU|nr:hypothetical protein [Amycolatopsis pretoriensis]SEF37556.1 hypothetical protein SAMN05421837_114116 [Amycolatopsis pretoriensis]
MTKFWWSAAAAVLLAGCASTAAPGDPPAAPGESAPATSGIPAEPTGPPESDPPSTSEPDPPGALGSPIDYQSTQVGSGDRLAEDVRESILGQLDEDTRNLGCPRPRCGITVRITGGETDCAKLLTPPERVERGGVIVIHTGPCPPTGDPVPPAESTSDTPSETP